MKPTMYMRNIPQNIYNENLSVCYLTLQFDFRLRLCVVNSTDKILRTYKTNNRKYLIL